LENISYEKTFEFISDLLGMNVNTDQDTIKDILSQMVERNVLEIFGNTIAHTI
jgi:hypothetical protein